jgi:hypothetical protein
MIKTHQVAVQHDKCVALHSTKHYLYMQLKFTCAALFLSIAGSLTASAETIKDKRFSAQGNFSDSVEIHSYDVKKNHVRLYPNPTSNGVITVNSNMSDKLHFYIFDLEGVLIRRLELKPKEQLVVSNLNKGSYTYDVFKDDESIEQGKIIVK